MLKKLYNEYVLAHTGVKPLTGKHYHNWSDYSSNYTQFEKKNSTWDSVNNVPLERRDQKLPFDSNYNTKCILQNSNNPYRRIEYTHYGPVINMNKFLSEINIFNGIFTEEDIGKIKCKDGYCFELNFQSPFIDFTPEWFSKLENGDSSIVKCNIVCTLIIEQKITTAGHSLPDERIKNEMFKINANVKKITPKGYLKAASIIKDFTFTREEFINKAFLDVIGKYVSTDKCNSRLDKLNSKVETRRNTIVTCRDTVKTILSHKALLKNNDNGVTRYIRDTKWSVKGNVKISLVTDIEFTAEEVEDIELVYAKLQKAIGISKEMFIIDSIK